MTEKELRIMQMDVLINAQRAKIELHIYSNTVGNMTNQITRSELKDMENTYGHFEKIIKELSDELKL